MNAFYLLCGLGVACLMAEILNLKRWLIPFLVIGLGVAIALLVQGWNNNVTSFSGMIIIDRVAIAFSILICAVAMLWFWLANGYFHKETHVTDQAALVIFVVVGAFILTSFNNMAMLFLGIE